MNTKPLLQSSAIAVAITLSFSLSNSAAAKPKRAVSGMPSNISSEPLAGDDSSIVIKRSPGQKTKLNGIVRATEGSAAKGELKGSATKDCDDLKLHKQKSKGQDKDQNVNEESFQSGNPKTQKVNEGDGNNNQNGVNQNGGKNEPDGNNNQSGSNY